MNHQMFGILGEGRQEFTFIVRIGALLVLRALGIFLLNICGTETYFSILFTASQGPRLGDLSLQLCLERIPPSSGDPHGFAL